MMEEIREAFKRVREDMEILKYEIDFLSRELIKTKNTLIDICSNLSKKDNLERNISLEEPKTKTDTSTNKQEFTTGSIDFSTNNYLFRALKPEILSISIGNEGVQTDRQTNRQTDRQIDRQTENNSEIQKKANFNSQNTNYIDKAVNMLDTLDQIKKELRLKFKRLTEQELAVFSTIYQLEEENSLCNYKILSIRLNLTESSIRDYVGRLIKKGIPLEKNKINNKNIQIFISPNLKKIATLSTIIQLRDL